MPLSKGKTAKELGFKSGDKFRVMKSPSLLFNKGDVIEFIYDDGTECPKFRRLSDGYVGYKYFEYLEPLEKTLDNLVEGDVVVDVDGDELTVLGVCGKAYIMSKHIKPDTFWGISTAVELEELGYKLKQPTPQS